MAKSITQQHIAVCSWIYPVHIFVFLLMSFSSAVIRVMISTSCKDISISGILGHFFNLLSFEIPSTWRTVKCLDLMIIILVSSN